MKVAPVSNICYLVFPAHLCPVRPRVLDSCSLIYRAIHIREVYGTPLNQSLIPSYFLGPRTSLGALLLSCTYAMFYCFIYDCARYCTLYCLGLVTRLRGIDSPRLGICCRLPPAPQTLGSVSELAYFVAGVLQGVAP